MTITKEQLDELEQCAQPVEGFPDAVRAVAVPGDVTLQLVTIARAAMVWRKARSEWQLRQTYSTRSALDEAGDRLEETLGVEL